MLVAGEPQSYESHNNLGFVLKDRGDYKQAKACFERALAIVRAAHGDAHEQTIVCLNNLGLLEDRRTPPLHATAGAGPASSRQDGHRRRS